MPGIPYAIAMELALTGDNLPAERARARARQRFNEPGTALDAIALAEKITASNGPLAVVATKRIITESRGGSSTMFAEQMKIPPVPVFSTTREGAVAFAEAPAPLDGHWQLRDGA